MKKKKGTHRLQLHVDDELREIFFGHHTLFSVLGFTVGGILIGGTLEKILHETIGRPLTLIVGLILLVISGIVLRIFSN